MLTAELMEVRQKLRAEIETRSLESSKLQAQVHGFQAQVRGLIEERTMSRQIMLIRALSTSLQYHLKRRLFPTLKFTKYAYSCTFDNLAQKVNTSGADCDMNHSTQTH
jgi:hypothetical protein